VKKFPWIGWLSGLIIFGFLFSGVFAPWISNNAPGNVNELREGVGKVLRLVSPETSSEWAEIQKQARQLRLLILSLSINYDESNLESEQKLRGISDQILIEATKLQRPELIQAAKGVHEMVLSRKDHLFPLFSVGPDMPSPDQKVILEAPSKLHPFGTDQAGRDVLSRLIHGIRNAIFFSLAVVIICILIGVLLGGLMGFYGGWIDLGLSRLMEVIGNFPIFLLQLTFLAYVDPSYGILLFVMCFSGWIPYCRFVRAEFFKLRSQEFVQAAQVLGASTPRIFFRHLIPNSLTPVITYIPFDLSSTIIALGALSFIGFGEPIDVPSVGELLRQAQRVFQTAWWLALFPGLALFLLTLSLALFGSAMRDFLDPRFKASKS